MGRRAKRDEKGSGKIEHKEWGIKHTCRSAWKNKVGEKGGMEGRKEEEMEGIEGERKEEG